MSSIIQQKATAYWDFRSGAIDDQIGSNDGAFVSTPVFNRDGLKFDGTDDAINFGATGLTVKTVALLLKPNTTTEDIADLDGGTHTIEVGAGTVTATGFSSPTIYVNGLLSSTLVAGTSQTIIITTATGISASAFHVGTETTFFDGVISAVITSADELTATEVAQLSGELKDTAFPTKSSAKAINKQIADIDDSNLIAAWNMKPQNNILPDLSGNGKDCTIVGASHQTSLLGDALAFDGVTDHLTTTYTVNNDNAFTTSVWVKTTDTDALNYIYGYYDAPKYWTLYTNATGNVLARIGQGSGGSLLTATSTGSINDGLWHNVMSIWDGVNTVTIYIDGVADGTATGAVSTFFAALTPRIAAFNHSATGTGNYLNCEMSNFEIYNEAKDATWVTEKYEKGARAVQYKTDWGVDVNVADVTSGEIANTNWQVNTGTWQVATDTIDGVKCKVLKCTTNNSLMYMNAGAVDIDNAENMYGTWEFYLYKGNGANAIHVSIKDEINLPGAGTANGYIFRMGASERFRLRKETAGTVSDLMTTDASFFNIDQWYKFKITRSNRGVFTVYIDNTLLAVTGGTNPVTDNTFTTAPYILIDMDNLDMIALADVSGNHSLTKHLGVI